MRTSSLSSRLTATLCCLGAAMCSVAQDVPVEQSAFTEHVAERLRKELADLPVIVKSPLTLSAGPLQANLDRIYGFCKSNNQRCSSEIDRYVKGVSQVVKERNAPIDRSAIRLVVRPTEYISRAQASFGTDGPVLQSQPLVEGLVIVPVLDTPRAIRPLDNRDLAAMNLSLEALMTLGRTNLEGTMKPLLDVAKATNAGQIGKIAGSVFDTSRIALHAQWAPLAEAQRGTLLVAIPTTDVLLYISESTPIAIDALRTFARSVASKAPNPLSGAVLKWTQDRWELVP